MPKWINVEERRPEAGRHVNVCDITQHVTAGTYTGRDLCGNYHFRIGCGWSHKITHWQELPKPPQSYTSDREKVYYKGNPMSPEYTAMLLNLLDCDGKAGEA